MTGPIMSEWDQVASRFGIAMEQVRRDHLISHVLAAIFSGVLYVLDGAGITMSLALMPC